MARRRSSLLSDATKLRLAQVQGAGDRVEPGYYGYLTSKEAGSFTKYALITAEQTLAGQQPGPGAQPQQPTMGLGPFPLR